MTVQRVNLLDCLWRVPPMRKLTTFWQELLRHISSVWQTIWRRNQRQASAPFLPGDLDLHSTAHGHSAWPPAWAALMMLVLLLAHRGNLAWQTLIWMDRALSNTASRGTRTEPLKLQSRLDTSFNHSQDPHDPALGHSETKPSRLVVSLACQSKSIPQFQMPACRLRLQLCGPTFETQWAVEFPGLDV